MQRDSYDPRFTVLRMTMIDECNVGRARRYAYDEPRGDGQMLFTFVFQYQVLCTFKNDKQWATLPRHQRNQS